MTYTQLWAYSPGTTTKQKLDLYPTEPIKLTFSAENLTDLPAINSVYSQTFRMPATGTNNIFFKFWFNVNINDFDVSKKVGAQIVTEAGIFIEGHIRLQKVYRNNQSTLVDYEVLFLGEVRDFSTQVGEGFMNTIDTSSLNHILNEANIEQSWLAVPNDVDGLLDGNVLYPLVEYGYAYDQSGVAQDSMIRATGTKAFTSNLNPLSIYQFRPWIRAKWLVDAIFAKTDYNYDSLFFNSALFNQLYINATGNVATTSMQDLLTNNLMDVRMTNQEWQTLGGVTQYWEWPNEIFDNGNNWDGQKYTAPVDGNYTFNWDLNGDVRWVNIGGGTGYPYPDTVMKIYYYVDAAPTLLSTHSNGGTDPSIFFFESGSATITLTAGQTVRFGYYVENLNGVPPTLLYITDTFANNLTVTSAPINVSISELLPNNIKLIDWFRALLKKFRLVMVPQKDNPKMFTIEPWEDYIGSGTTYDWTHKLDGSKDIQFEPLFFTQSASIKFTDSEDQDHPNVDNQTVFKEVYGTRFFDSNNELLKDERTIDTVFAPTPVEIIDDRGTNTTFVLPHLAKIEAASNNTNQLKPIVAKPRLMFYNGMYDGSLTWYWGTTPTAETTYPLLTYASDFPTLDGSLNLNWEIEPGRWPNPSSPQGSLGQDVYTRYWKGYVDSIYSSEARKMTATFVLDAKDLKVDFNDTIFIKDSWWRVLKINNAPLSGVNPIQIELIKVFDAPDNSCDCREYYVTDNRTLPESPFYFTYVDCTTGLEVQGSVNQNSIAVCSCEPFTTNDKFVPVTTYGFSCTPPNPPSPVEVLAEKSANNPGSVLLDQSPNGTSDWVNVDSDDLPIGESTTTLSGNVDDGNFFRVGYVNTSGSGDTIDITFYRDGVAIFQEQLLSGLTPRYSVCPEANSVLYTYTAIVTIS